MCNKIVVAFLSLLLAGCVWTSPGANQISGAGAQPEIVAILDQNGQSVLATATPSPDPTEAGTVPPSPLPTQIFVDVITPTVFVDLVTPTQTPPVVIGGDGACRLDKISTANEIYDVNLQYVGPQRMEVGGNGVQHADLYPAPAVQAVSYIIPQQEPIEVYGHGSIWEGNGSPCQGYDYVKDAIDYAQERLNNGHSGIVVDLRSGQPLVVANLQNLTQDQISALMTMHATATAGQIAVTDAVGVTTPMPLPPIERGTPVATTTVAGPVPANTPVATQVSSVATSAPTQAPAQSCTGVTERKSPAVGTPWIFTTTGPTVLNFWSNEQNQDQAEKTMTLRPGSYSILGGGTLTQYAAGCEAIAQQEMAANGLPQTTYETWIVDRGLATR